MLVQTIVRPRRNRARVYEQDIDTLIDSLHKCQRLRGSEIILELNRVADLVLSENTPVDFARMVVRQVQKYSGLALGARTSLSFPLPF
jgi:hypothetical protein